jgi:hypothetical protein
LISNKKTKGTGEVKVLRMMEKERHVYTVEERRRKKQKIETRKM